MKTIDVPKGKRIYFSSDNHLGAPTKTFVFHVKKKFVAWWDA